MTDLRKILIRILSGPEQTLFPAICLRCGAFISSPEHALFRKDFWRHFRETFPDSMDFCQIMAPFFCPECASDVLPADPPICKRCGVSLRTSGKHSPLCDRCSASPPLFRMARAYGTYENILKEAIHLFKYRGKTRLAIPFGLLLFSVFARYWDPHDTDMIIPVPLHIRRFRKRGFNQAYLPLRNWKSMAGIFGTDISHIQIRKNVLLRVRPTDTQVGMDQEERRRNIRDAFRVDRPAEIRGKNILLVDDVITTGATADVCAEMLLDNGARHADVLTLAHTPRRKPF